MLARYPVRFLGYGQLRKMSDLKLQVCPCSSHNLGYYTLVSTLPSTWKVSKLRREVGRHLRLSVPPDTTELLGCTLHERCRFNIVSCLKLSG